MTLAGAVVSNTPLTEQIVLGANNFRKGATAPADGTLGTTPTTPTVLMANTAELLTVGTLMPTNWDRTVDVTLFLIWALASVQLNGDTLDATINYTVPLLNAGGTGPGKASSQVTGQITAITGQLAIGDTYAMPIALARGDATNPYTSADAIAFVLEFGLTNITGVASAHFLGACIEYERLR